MKSPAGKYSLFLVLCFAFHGLVFALPVTTNFTQGPDNVEGNPTSGIYDPVDVYPLPPGKTGKAFLNPLLPTDQLNPSVNFRVILQAAFPAPGWTFPNSPKELTTGSLEVRTYDVIGTPTEVGADFHVKYRPGVGDPTAATHDIHWIQVLKNNHKLSNPHGTPDNKVDILAGSTSPFYDELGAANSTDFFDGPRRLDGENEHFFDFELFLVTRPLGSGLAAGEVTVWSGVNWGWANVVAEPSSTILFSIGLLAGLLGYTSRRRT